MLLEGLQFVSGQQGRFVIISSFLETTKRCQQRNRSAKAAQPAEKYSKDICSEDLVQKMNDITLVHIANFGREQLGALELLNSFAAYRLEGIFPSLSVRLRMFPTAPVTVATVSDLGCSIQHQSQ